MRQLATVQSVVEIQPIEGADSIEKVKIKDWWCIAKKGEFQVGGLCVYFEIDSLLPLTNAAFSFLEKGGKKKSVMFEGKEYTGYRLKTVRLRGQISQGLALPLASLGLDSTPGIFAIGADVSDILGLVKFEQPIPAHLSGKVKSTRPGFIPKTDEERVQNLGYLVEASHGMHFYVTEKLDGSSATYYKKDGIFGVCSRNMELLDTPENTFWNIARKYNLAEILPDGYAIQGELVGESIQNNPLKMSGHDFYAYNVYIIKDSKYLDFEFFVGFCKRLNVQTVPVLETDYVLDTNVEGLIKKAEGKSVINTASNREGLVFRPIRELYTTIAGTLQRFSFKAISNEYLLNHDS